MKETKESKECCTYVYKKYENTSERKDVREYLLQTIFIPHMRCLTELRWLIPVEIQFF